MRCTGCGSEMSIGAPHSEGVDYQYECQCGQIIPVVEERQS